MTDREKAIVMAYTGTAMLTGEKLSIFYKYIEDILGRPVWTHELLFDSVCEEIKEKSKSDFLELCKNEERTQGEWIKDNSGNRFCSECGSSALYHEIGLIIESRFCPNCGCDMRKPNCVTCDHFGNCEGCEKGEEE